MRVICPHCATKAHITKASHSADFKTYQLFCACINTADCGATFVYEIQYSHDLKAPMNSAVIAAKNAFLALSESEQALLRLELFP